MERALKYALTAVAVGVEIANDKWGAPLRLKGWASEVSECLNSGELDDPLKRVADKYTAALSKTATCPEMQLAVGLLISISMVPSDDVAWNDATISFPVSYAILI